jgi:hypothetical protein
VHVNATAAGERKDVRKATPDQKDNSAWLQLVGDKAVGLMHGTILVHFIDGVPKRLERHERELLS